MIAKYLPAKLDVCVFCNLTGEQKDLYSAVCADARKDSNQKTSFASAFQTVSLLKKIANDPEAAFRTPAAAQAAASQAAAAGAAGGTPDAAEATRAAGNEPCCSANPFGGVFQTDGGARPAAMPGACGGSSATKGGPVNIKAALKVSGKLQVLTALLRETRQWRPEDRFVLISNSTQTLDLFAAVLKADGQRYKRLDGSVATAKRQECVDVFNSDPSYFAFLLSSKAGGCGINLIGANRLVLFDPDWNPAIDQQALARVWRSGQKKACYVYRFFAVGSLEEVCYERQCKKEGLAASLMDGDGDSVKFSEAELRSLFNPNFYALSSAHLRSKCQCCVDGQGPREDSKGFYHLLPGAPELTTADPCLAQAAKSSGMITLCYTKVTDANGSGFPTDSPR